MSNRRIIHLNLGEFTFPGFVTLTTSKSKDKYFKKHISSVHLKVKSQGNGSIGKNYLGMCLQFNNVRKLSALQG